MLFRSSTTAQYVTANAQANITSVGTLTSMSVSGNIQSGNIRTAGLISATGNVTANGVFSTGNVSATGNIIVPAGKYFIGDGGFISNVQAASNVIATTIANGTTSIQVVESGGNLLYSVGGITVATWDSITAGFTANVKTSGNVTATGNVKIGRAHV